MLLQVGWGEGGAAFRQYQPLRRPLQPCWYRVVGGRLTYMDVRGQQSGPCAPLIYRPTPPYPAHLTHLVWERAAAANCGDPCRLAQMVGLHRRQAVALCFPSGELQEGAHPKTRALLSFLQGYDAQASVHGIIFTQTRQVRGAERGPRMCSLKMCALACCFRGWPADRPNGSPRSRLLAAALLQRRSAAAECRKLRRRLRLQSYARPPTTLPSTPKCGRCACPACRAACSWPSSCAAAACPSASSS
jgi:hypothetical protein